MFLPQWTDRNPVLFDLTRVKFLFNRFKPHTNNVIVIGDSYNLFNLPRQNRKENKIKKNADIRVSGKGKK